MLWQPLVKPVQLLLLSPPLGSCLNSITAVLKACSANSCNIQTSFISWKLRTNLNFIIYLMSLLMQFTIFLYLRIFVCKVSFVYSSAIFVSDAHSWRFTNSSLSYVNTLLLYTVINFSYMVLRYTYGMYLYLLFVHDNYFLVQKEKFLVHVSETQIFANLSYFWRHVQCIFNVFNKHSILFC
jgi:hypothetical protein